ncbi:UNVERIFIED_CONTAM: Palmitoyl-protein thioesterase 1 [Sesamum radiatum]|uniref:Palmitoyl-protein thioesterase 1 n=1 Tax=Sesamum radiatum TaxID=300843 RepID=A0AAW2L3Y4_SESRA
MVNRFAPSGYTKLPQNIPDYLEKCRFLPKLNNERPDQRNPIYKKRFSSLKNLVLIMNTNDTVIKPKESSWFGYYADGGLGTILQPQETKLYTEDWIGLKTLDKAGRVKFIKAAGGHVDMSDADIKKYVVPYLRGSKRRPDVHDGSAAAKDNTGSEEVTTTGN